MRNINKKTELILCIFGGCIGLHKFYERKIGMGILYLFTFGIFGIGWVTDVIFLLKNYRKENYQDKKIYKVIVGFLVLMVFGYFYGQTDEYEQSIIEKEQNELAQLKEEIKEQENYIKELESNLESTETSETEEVLPAEAPINTPELKEENEKEATELSEEEYKGLCTELYYDDMFFEENNLEGEYIKLHLFLSEKYYFTADNMYSDAFKSYNDKYNMCRDFFKASVLRKGEKSYVGVGKVNLWFSEDIGIDPNTYKTGDHIIVYAEVISWSNNTTNGYNSVTIIPRYIEEEN